METRNKLAFKSSSSHTHTNTIVSILFLLNYKFFKNLFLKRERERLEDRMSAKGSSSSPSIRDPSTNLHRPTSAKTPDVAHILTSVFGQLFTKDVLTTDIIKNLTVSSDVDDEYHRSYVSKLKEVGSRLSRV